MFSTAFGQYMSEEEIQNEFSNLSQARAMMDTNLSDAAKARLNNMKPLNVFVSPTTRKTLKSTYKPLTYRNMMAVSSADLRHRDTSVKSQDNGKCTAFSGTALIENLLQRNGKIAGLNLSEWDAWSHYGQYSCDAFVTAMTKKLICNESEFPMYGTKTSKCTKNEWVGLQDVLYIDDDVNAMISSLSSGNPVYIGMATPNSMLNCDAVINPKSTIADGGHALAVVGFTRSADGKDVIATLKNSWGTDCADQGYQYYPMSLCKKTGSYCVMWSFKSVRTSTPVVVPTVKPTIIPTAKPTVRPTIVPTVKPVPTPVPAKVCVRWSGHLWWKKCVQWQ